MKNEHCVKQNKVNLVAIHGHLYARWKSKHEQYRNNEGKLVSKIHLEPTGVPVPPPDATPEI